MEKNIKRFLFLSICFLCIMSTSFSSLYGYCDGLVSCLRETCCCCSCKPKSTRKNLNPNFSQQLAESVNLSNDEDGWGVEIERYRNKIKKNGAQFWGGAFKLGGFGCTVAAGIYSQIYKHGENSKTVGILSAISAACIVVGKFFDDKVVEYVKKEQLAEEKLNVIIAKYAERQSTEEQQKISNNSKKKEKFYIDDFKVALKNRIIAKRRKFNCCGVNCRTIFFPFHYEYNLDEDLESDANSTAIPDNNLSKNPDPDAKPSSSSSENNKSDDESATTEPSSSGS